MAFKISATSVLSLESPESLFRDIKTKKVHGPLADQADLWRLYQETAVNKPDVALQLPTGGGKTLVGIGLAEWRRLKFQERVVFLCPTRQLVNQVVEQATVQYGIKVNGFSGTKGEYNKDAMAEYLNCERVAVTTYSSLFNSAPFFDDPHIILLDDAHASEQYIANMWSFSVEQSEATHKAMYNAITGVLGPVMPKSDFHRLVDPNQDVRDRQWVDKLPTPILHTLIPELVAAVDAIAFSGHNKVGAHRFAWKAIRDHLEACHLYMGPGAILIRPILPPTSTHHPFAKAKQRIYMSATFGGSGELERITGRPEIERLVTKASWARQSIGRRYFLFPERSLPEADQWVLNQKMMQRAGRTLVLAPDGGRARNFEAFVHEKLHYKVFDAAAIEESKAGFVALEQAVAIVANRYDGIDFPENQCRLSIIEGLPRATNLQEQFLIRRIGAVDLLNVRITTRLVQAFGRCTRSDQDYSAVIIRGEELNKHLMTRERRTFLHPELQAELEFGIEQAKGASIDDFLENFNFFLAQGEEWGEADGHIRKTRDGLSQEKVPGADDLASAVALEVEYLEAIWNKNYTNAFDLARAVLAKLNTPGLRGYRCLWHYLAGSAAWLAFKTGSPKFDVHAREQYLTALKTERTLAWLVPLSKLAVMKAEDSAVIEDKDTWSIVERLESLFERLGTLTDFRYTKFEAEIRTKLANNDAKSFEEGHAKLGELLGYDAGNRNDTASPDPWWMANGSRCFVFEDHSDAKSESSLSVDKARQVCTHPNWIRTNLPVDTDAVIVPILVTPVKIADDAALAHLSDVLLWPLDEFRKWADEAIGTVRELRKQYPNSGDLAWRAWAAEKLEAAHITPSALERLLKERVAANELKRPK